MIIIMLCGQNSCKVVCCFLDSRHGAIASRYQLLNTLHERFTLFNAPCRNSSPFIICFLSCLRQQADYKISLDDNVV
jgi:hypothetical protein